MEFESTERSDHSQEKIKNPLYYLLFISIMNKIYLIINTFPAKRPIYGSYISLHISVMRNKRAHI